jgi:hypothetical protein
LDVNLLHRPTKTPEFCKQTPEFASRGQIIGPNYQLAQSANQPLFIPPSRRAAAHASPQLA